MDYDGMKGLDREDYMSCIYLYRQRSVRSASNAVRLFNRRIWKNESKQMESHLIDLL